MSVLLMLPFQILVRIKQHRICNLFSNSSESIIQKEDDEANEALHSQLRSLGGGY